MANAEEILQNVPLKDLAGKSYGTDWILSAIINSELKNREFCSCRMQHHDLELLRKCLADHQLQLVWICAECCNQCFRAGPGLQTWALEQNSEIPSNSYFEIEFGPLLTLSVKGGSDKSSKSTAVCVGQMRDAGFCPGFTPPPYQWQIC